MNKLEIILGTQIILITKSELLTIGGLALLAHFLVYTFQSQTKGTQKLQELSFCTHLRLSLSSTFLYILIAYLYLLFLC